MCRILIAEDEDDIRILIQMILKSKNFDVSVVSNGEEAIKAIRETNDTATPYDILITDIQMPKMNGLELLREIKEQGYDISVLVMTGFGDKNMIVELMKIGCSNYIDKPFTEDDLSRTVSEIITDRHKAKIVQECHKDKFEIEYNNLQEQVCDAKEIYEDLVRFEDSSIPANIAIKNKPKSDLGGDYFAIKKVKNGFALFIADVSGHDMGASYYTILLKTFFEEYCTHFDTGFEGFFDALNKALATNNQARMITGQVAYWDLTSNTVRFQNAGHHAAFHQSLPLNILNPLYLRQNILGILPDVQFETAVYPFKKGDRFFFYTDGLADLLKVDGSTGNKQTWGQQSIKDSIQKNHRVTINDAVEAMWDEGFTFSHYKSSDDVLLIGVEIGE